MSDFEWTMSAVGVALFMWVGWTYVRSLGHHAVFEIGLVAILFLGFALLLHDASINWPAVVTLMAFLVLVGPVDKWLTKLFKKHPPTASGDKQ